MIEALSMGNYGVYVWSSVGLVVSVLLLMTWRAHHQFKRVQTMAAWSKHAQS